MQQIINLKSITIKHASLLYDLLKLLAQELLKMSVD